MSIECLPDTDGRQCRARVPFLDVDGRLAPSESMPDCADSGGTIAESKRKTPSVGIDLKANRCKGRQAVTICVTDLHASEDEIRWLTSAMLRFRLFSRAWARA